MQLECPLELDARQFNHIYENEMDVFEVNDLTVTAPDDAPCINVLIRGSLDCKPSMQRYKPNSNSSSPINFTKNVFEQTFQRRSH